MATKRKNHEPPLATCDWGWKYHHVGIPTNETIAGESYLPQFKLYAGGFSTSPFGVEWMRFEVGSTLHELIQRVPHVAFEVADLVVELNRHDFNIIIHPNSPAEGIKVAMIEHNGAPIELIEFSKSK